jgi:hypothetical protein
MVRRPVFFPTRACIRAVLARACMLFANAVFVWPHTFRATFFVRASTRVASDAGSPPLPASLARAGNS